MSRRPNKRQHANDRLRERRAEVAALPPGVEHETRAPLAGYEGLYEITRCGRVYSLRHRRFLAPKIYQGPPYIEFQVNGRKVALNIDDAVKQSWGDRFNKPDPPPASVAPMLMRVDIPATTIIVLVSDATGAPSVAAKGLEQEIRNGVVAVAATPVRGIADVPSEWQDAIPYVAAGIEEDQRSIAERIGGTATTRASRSVAVI